jgi:hypothetical protein
MSYLERETAAGPKRLLALDGGGIRGHLTLQVLAALEDLLREQSGADERFVLADWFDYVAGTSTGAVLAAGIARGMRVHEIADLYDRLGADMFKKPFLPHRVLDEELGGLYDEPGPAPVKLFTYLRYNADLSRRGLDALGLRDIDPEAIRKLDSLSSVDDLRRVGRAVAERDVCAEHYRAFRR